MPYDWTGRCKCIETVRAQTHGLVADEILDAFFDQGVVIYMCSGDTPDEILLTPFMRVVFVHLYFTTSVDGITFDGAILPCDATLTLASSPPLPRDRHQDEMKVAVAALAKAPDIARASLGHVNHLRWLRGEFFVHIDTPPDSAHRRISIEEIVLGARRRAKLYRILDRSNACVLDKKTLDVACPASTERAAAVEWLVVLFISICYAQSYDTFVWLETVLLRHRLTTQVRIPEERMSVLSYNDIERAYIEEHARNSDVDFVDFVCRKYQYALHERYKDVRRSILGARDSDMSESVRLTILRVGGEINASLDDGVVTVDQEE